MCRGERDVHQCPVCGKKCATATKLLQHMERHEEAHEDVVRAAAALGAEYGATHSAHWQNCEQLPSEMAAEMAPAGQEVDPLAHDLARARIVNHVPRDTMVNLKKAMQDMVSKLHKDAVDKLSPKLAAGVDAETVVAEVFQGLQETLGKLSVRDGELKHVREHASFVEPVQRYLGSRSGGAKNEKLEDFFAYDGGLHKTLEAMFATCPDIWADVESFKTRVEARMRTSEKYDESARISDMIDGVEFGRFFVRLKLQPGEIPLAFIFYYDGLEVVSGLGQARLTHELACFYWALVPVSDFQKRLQPENLRLATVCLKRAIAHVGMDVVVNGRPGDEKSKTAWGAQMTVLGSKAGMELKTPSGKKRKFRGGTPLVAADTPAGAELFGVKKSVGPSTKSVCKGCHCSQHGDPPPYRQANSFLSSCEGWKRPCAGRQQKFELRSIKDLKQYLQKLEKVKCGELSEADLEAWKQEVGVNEFISVMCHCPYLSLATGCPMDMMHILLEGTARNLLAICSFVMIRRWGINADDLVTAIERYAQAHKCKRAKYPHVNSSRITKLREGTEQGVCKPDCDFPGTAMQVHSVRWLYDSNVIAV